MGQLRVEVGVPEVELTNDEGEHRSVAILGGRLEGELGEGTVMPGGSDRQIVHSDGSISIDAGYELELTDGTVVSVHSVGVRTVHDADVYFRTGIRLTTASDRPDINGHLFVSTGYRTDSTVVLDLYRVS